MFDEQAFIQRLEAADTRQLATMLANPNAEEERVLRIYLGDATYERQHELALQAVETRRGQLISLDLDTPSRGRVVVIHGIMGAELGYYAAPDATAFDLLWVSYRRLLGGWLNRLRLDGDGGQQQHDVRAVGIMTSHYGELLLRLLTENWDAHPFWFDWRKDLAPASDSLNAKIKEWFPGDDPVHIVAHSMGGLVARTYIRNHSPDWAALRGGKLIMLGTPTYGSFIIPQLITGVETMVSLLALLNVGHSLEDVLAVVNTFPGSFQMLPSPFVMERMHALYRAPTYGDPNVRQHLLDAAYRHHELLRDNPEDDKHMIYVAGYGNLTPCDIRDTGRVRSPLDYDVTKAGDGRVTHELGIPRLNGKKPISQVYYTPVVHGEMSRNPTLIEAVCELLRDGRTEVLERHPPDWLIEETRAAPEATQDVLRNEYIEQQRAILKAFNDEVIKKAEEQRAAHTVSTSVSELDRLTRESLLGDGPVVRRDGSDQKGGGEGEGRSPEHGGATRTEPEAAQGELFPIEIRLRWAFIQDVGEEAGRHSEDEGDEQKRPVDAIAVGHYFGYSKPLMAEEALDEAISRKLFGVVPAKKLEDTERLLTLYSYRGIIRGELGQPFFLEDPRKEGRLVVLAGMGEAGRFWTPELTVLARELCWALGRVGKEHLATVLIGAGQGNMQVDEAVAAWMRGIKYALTGARREKGEKEWQLKRVTFVEADPRKLRAIEEAILRFKRQEVAERKRATTDSSQRAAPATLQIDYRELELDRLKSKRGLTIAQEIEERVRREVEKAQEAARREPAAGEDADVPVRVTLSLEGMRYRFGAITRTASVPERETNVNPKLVMEVNDDLPAAHDIKAQREVGRHLEGLLMPKDLRPVFATEGPIVMMLDATTARIHWEMLPQPDTRAAADADDNEMQNIESFLSIGRGFTRQLRTTFAPPPEPPPPPRRVLRVLIVADPWEENRLRGAEAEGREIEKLFNEFNRLYGSKESSVEVVSLIGPAAATLKVVHRHLTLHHYDILHFAGHCKFVAEDPSASGWQFTGGDVLSANELNRVDNIPKFVFSNACESGVTPDRAERRNALLAPSFAEAFFARGVANFVCTAWPVSDTAARLFARTLYTSLLGLKAEPGEPTVYVPSKQSFKMYQAMQEARRAVVKDGRYGARTWGAYQHYGNPYLQFFDKEVFERAQASQSESGTTSEAANPISSADAG